jgi:tetratricopeptide (TPR) repeat protein
VDEDALIGALGKLSRAVRGKIGESLKTIRDTKGLERVSTPSLAALRKYVEGVRQSDEIGNAERGIELLQEAVTLDTAFAMAWRKIAVVVGNLQTDRPRSMAAVVRAFQHRERLSETERLLTEAYYYSNGPKPDREKALAAYQALLDVDPKNTTAANNAAVLLMQKREFEKAEQYYGVALDEKRPFGSTFTNLLMAQLRLGRVAAAESTQTEFRRRLLSTKICGKASGLCGGRKEFRGGGFRCERRIPGSQRMRQSLRGPRFSPDVESSGRRYGMGCAGRRSA